MEECNAEPTTSTDVEADNNTYERRVPMDDAADGQNARAESNDEDSKEAEDEGQLVIQVVVAKGSAADAVADAGVVVKEVIDQLTGHGAEPRLDCGAGRDRVLVRIKGSVTAAEARLAIVDELDSSVCLLGGPLLESGEDADLMQGLGLSVEHVSVQELISVGLYDGEHYGETGELRQSTEPVHEWVPLKLPLPVAVAEKDRIPYWATLRRAGLSVDEIVEVASNSQQQDLPLLGPSIYKSGPSPLLDGDVLDDDRHDVLLRLGDLLRRSAAPEAVVAAAMELVAGRRFQNPWDAGAWKQELDAVDQRQDERTEDDLRWPELHAGGVADVIVDVGFDDVLENEELLKLVGRLDPEIIAKLLSDRRWKGIKALRVAVDAVQERAGHAKREGVLTVVPDAPVSSAHLVPSGWELGPKGVTSVPDSGSPKRVAPAPIVVTRRDVDVASGDHAVTLAWKNLDEWQTVRAPRAQVATARAIVELAGNGLPVTSSTAGKLVDWIARYEAVNRKSLSPLPVSSRVGWHLPKGYLFGDEWLGDGLPVGQVADGAIAQVARAIRCHGDAAKQQGMLKLIAQYPRVLAVIGVCFASPLLEIFGAPSMVLSLSNETSTGKTTTVKAGGSIYGANDERREDSLVQTWGVTPVWIDGVRVGMDGVPLILDDTQRAKDPAMVARVIYDVASGRGRGRGRTDGTAKGTASVRSVLISTGEVPALDATRQGGTRGRVLELWGPPWGGVSDETARVVREVAWTADENYGHVGRAWITWLLSRRPQWKKWRDKYRTRARAMGEDVAAMYSQHARAVTGRLAEQIAIISAALRTAKRAGLLPASDAEIQAAIDILVTDALREAAERDMPLEALQLLMETASARREAFYNPHNEEQRFVPPTGWWGRWETAGDLYVMEPWLNELLEEHGFPRAVVRTWVQRTWVQTDKEGRTKSKVRIGKGEGPTRAVRFSMTALKDALGYDPNGQG